MPFRNDTPYFEAMPGTLTEIAQRLNKDRSNVKNKLNKLELERLVVREGREYVWVGPTPNDQRQEVTKTITKTEPIRDFKYYSFDAFLSRFLQWQEEYNIPIPEGDLQQLQQFVMDNMTVGVQFALAVREIQLDFEKNNPNCYDQPVTQL